MTLAIRIKNINNFKKCLLIFPLFRRNTQYWQKKSFQIINSHLQIRNIIL